MKKMSQSIIKIIQEKGIKEKIIEEINQKYTSKKLKNTKQNNKMIKIKKEINNKKILYQFK